MADVEVDGAAVRETASQTNIGCPYIVVFTIGDHSCGALGSLAWGLTMSESWSFSAGSQGTNA